MIFFSSDSRLTLIFPSAISNFTPSGIGRCKLPLGPVIFNKPSLKSTLTSFETSISLLPIENCDHFDTVDCIGDPNSNLFKKIMNNIVKTL